MKIAVGVHLTHKDKEVVAFISGESYENLTEEQIINNIGLYVSSDDS
ncbi:long-chain fatty acid--CoA ligase [Acidianus brierleyi]|nr:long-chain fatty acid--CoA ligase [Acidianus brierleyi]